MAEASTKESQSRDYGKSTQKFFNRTLEKVMHKVGKSDKTSDEDFDAMAQRFNEQQAAALRLQKELKAYVAQSKAMTNATQSLYTAMRDIYEADWENSTEFRDQAERLPTLQTTLLSELNEKVITQMNNYAAQFPLTKEKIAKRRRKLVDYDVARHNVQSLENAKKRNDFKITQAHDEFMAAKTVYDNINRDLQSELPTLYDSRIESLCSCFDVLLTTELEFDSQCATIKREMSKFASTMCRRAATEGSTSRLTSSRDSSNRQVNEYVNSNDIKSFQRLSTPDEISRQPVLTAVIPTNGKPSTQLSRDSVFSETDVEDIKLEQKHHTSSDYRKPSENFEKEPIDAHKGAPQQQSLNPGKSSTAESFGSKYSFNEPTENGFENDNFSEAKFGSSNRSSTSVSEKAFVQSTKLQKLPSQDKVQNSDEKAVNQQFSNGTEEDDLFSEEMLKIKQQDELLKQQQQLQQYEQLRQQELDIERQMKQQQNPMVDEIETVDAATSFLSSPELTSDFFAAKKNAKTKSKDVVLYSVVVTNPYGADDEEELNLEPGHVINVVEPRPDDEPLDDGWLMGFNTATGLRGLFPANFTKPLE